MGKIAQLFSKKQKINEKVKCNAITQSIIDKVGCPYQVFFSDTEHSKVIEEYERQLERGKRQGFVPVLVPSDNYLDEWLDVMKEDGYSKEELLSSEVLDGEEILNKRYQDYMSNYEEDIFEHEEWNEQIEEGAYNNCLSSFIEYNSDKIKETILFKIPVTYPWQVMAWIPMGGWNECPETKEMLAICKYWYEKYGAIPAVLSHDIIEFTVPEPVEQESEAWKLAKEQYAFSPDVVEQCTFSGTLGEVADRIRQSTVWGIWWD